jgi:hypothetical protein
MEFNCCAYTCRAPEPYPSGDHDMLIKNAWYIAAWGHEVGEQLLARTICNEEIVLFRDRETGKAAACPFETIYLAETLDDLRIRRPAITRQENLEIVCEDLLRMDEVAGVPPDLLEESLRILRLGHDRRPVGMGIGDRSP